MSSVLRVGIALLLAVAVTAAPVQTCEDQASCLSFSFHKVGAVAGCETGNCPMQVCLDINRSKQGCVKGTTDTLSHSCVKDAKVCQAGQATFGGAVETQNVADLSQCQIGYPGAQLHFLLKDGQGCSATQGVSTTTGPYSSAAWKSKFGLDAADNAAVQCKSRPADVPSCTGNGVGVECVWTVKVPDCPAGECERLDVVAGNLKYQSPEGPSCSLEQTLVKMAPWGCKRLSPNCQVMQCDYPFNAEAFALLERPC